MDILKTFLSLTDYTYTLGDEHELEDRLPNNILRDAIGNYFLKIGDSETMFCSHLDTAAFKKEKVIHDVFKTKGGDTGVGTDGSTLLGADDKAGVVLMLNMIENNIPGLYYFFIGEESGLVGSKGALKNYSENLSKYKRCISFDRRDYGSVITKQMGSQCCSTEFADALISELAKGKMKFKQDPTGVFTDSAVFRGIIPECTNLSVGYFNEHSVNEVQNITYLEELAAALLLVDWEKLPSVRKPEIEETYRHSGFSSRRKPKKRRKSGSSFTDKELEELFYDVDELIEDYIGMYCDNYNDFEPDEKMTYIDFYDQEKIISVYIHEDGSITAGKDYFNSFDDFKNTLEYYYEYNQQSKYNEEEDDDYDTSKYNDGGRTPEEMDAILYDDADFEKGINIPDFIHDVLSLSYDKDRNYLTLDEVNKLLKKRNKEIESFIIWLYYSGRGEYNEYGLKWDSDRNVLMVYDMDSDLEK